LQNRIAAESGSSTFRRRGPIEWAVEIAAKLAAIGLLYAGNRSVLLCRLANEEKGRPIALFYFGSVGAIGGAATGFR
jgi:hypothetical protein